MQIIQILNDFIQVLYSPDFENIGLADFMLVKDGKMCYLGQVVEISDDKFDNEKNIAKIKLMHTINGLGDITQYTRQLPNKHAEVLFANQREILNFINQDKNTVTIGEDVKNSNEFEINIDFFENNAVMFCDKIADYNFLAEHLTRRLNPHRRVVVFDYTGGIRIPASRELKAKIDFKLPLNSYTIDRIWQKSLAGASLETQAVLEEIFNEIKNYSKLTKDGFIPFNHFIKVISKQYKATPIKELLVLKNKLTKYQQEDIFASRKTDFKSAFEKLNTSRTTVINMSNVKNDWQKDFMEFALRSIKTESFVFLRINENNYDPDIFNYATNSNRQYKLIPAIAHSFNKLPVICESRYNYIITPSLNAKKNFGYFGNVISALSKNNVMLLGEDTKDFAFIVKNIKIIEKIVEADNEKFEAKVTLEGDVIKNKRVKEKIESIKEQKSKEIENIVDGFLYNAPQNTINSTSHNIYSTQKQDLSTQNEQVVVGNAQIEPQVEEIENKTPQAENSEAIEEVQIQKNVLIETFDAPENENYDVENLISEDELDFFSVQEENTEVQTSSSREGVQDAYQEAFSDDFLDALDEINLQNANIDSPETINSIEHTEETSLNAEAQEDFQELDSEMENLVNESVEIAFDEMLNEDEEKFETEQGDENLTPELYDKDEDEFNVMNEIEDDLKPQEAEDVELEEFIEEIKEETTTPKENTEKTPKENTEETSKENAEETSEETSEGYELKLVEQPILEGGIEQFDLDGPLDDDTLKYTHDYIEEIPTPESPAPSSSKDFSFKEGDMVTHEKYGKGKVLQVVEYSNKTLLQIDFTQIGKRLLDPEVSGITKA